MNETLAGWKSDNKQSLGELFFKFLEYFANFEYGLDLDVGGHVERRCFFFLHSIEATG